MNLKQKLSFILLSALFTAQIFAQNWNNARVVVLNPDSENLSQSEASWLPNTVRGKIEGNLISYTNFILIDNANENRIKLLQKKAGTAAFDENTAIEIGKLTSAQYAIFSTIIKNGSSYTLTLSFTNLTTGQKYSSVNITRKNSSDELYGNAGCAVDEATIKLCEQLGIPLSASQKFSLRKGDVEFTTEDQLSRAIQEERAFKELLENYDRQMKALSRTNDLSTTAAKAKVEAERALAEEKLKASQEKARLLEKRLAEENKKQEEDLANDERRSAEQKAKRDQMANMAAEKLASVKNNSVNETGSIWIQIDILRSIIDSKKKALAEIRNNVQKQIQEIRNAASNEAAQRKRKIVDEPYRTAELVNGVPTPTAKEIRDKARKAKETEIENEIAQRREKEENDIKASTKKQEDALEKEIQSDIATFEKLCKELAKIRTISSLGQEVKHSIDNYKTDIQAWPVTFYIYINGKPICQTNSFIYYKDLTGKEVVTDNSDYNKYLDYLDTVDLYESLFSRGEPIVYFEMNYNVMLDSYDSKEYKFTFSNLQIKNTISGKKIAGIKFYSVNYKEYLTIQGMTFSKSYYNQQIKDKKQRIKDYYHDDIVGACIGCVLLPPFVIPYLIYISIEKAKEINAAKEAIKDDMNRKEAEFKSAKAKLNGSNIFNYTWYR